MVLTGTGSAPPCVFNVDQDPPVPATDFKVVEEPENYNVRAELPTGESVKVGITIERILAVVGEKTVATQREGGSEEDTRKEFFQRAIPLPESVDATSITAQLDKQGHLSVYLPKKAADALSSQPQAISSRCRAKCAV